jgi:hypothetical protein
MPIQRGYRDIISATPFAYGCRALVINETKRCSEFKTPAEIYAGLSRSSMLPGMLVIFGSN